MAKQAAHQMGTIIVVILVVFFCISGMADNTPLPDSPAGITDCTDGFSTLPDFSRETSALPDGTPSDPAQPRPLRLGQAPEGYFSDALFIGDSRTVGLQEYGGIPGASFFATPGMSVYSIFYEEVANTDFTSLMKSQKFGKIYVMLGINELGYDLERTVTKYENLIEWIRLCQPEAVIFIEANLHVAQSRSERDSVYNNENLDAFNSRIAAIADGQRIFYLDVNPLFDDGNGNLAGEYTVDDTHVLGKYYRVWSDWIGENAAVEIPENPNITDNGE